MQGQELLASEVAACKELISLEPDTSKCKWPLLTLARLHRLQVVAFESACNWEGMAAMERWKSSPAGSAWHSACTACIHLQQARE